MPVKIRLARGGRKGYPVYSIVVADSRSPRDGRFIEKLGTYNPNTQPTTVLLNDDSALEWLMNGAQPTDTTRRLLTDKGVMFRKHLQVGVNKGAISQEVADTKFAAWKSAKEAKLQKVVEASLSAAEKAKKDRMAAEVKKKEARAVATHKKQQPPQQEEQAAE